MTEQLGSSEAFDLVMQGVDRMLAERQHVYPLKMGALALLKYYQTKGVICAVASSSAISHIQHRLSHVNVLHFFSTITSGQEVTRGKPAPDIYLLAMQKLGVQAEECLAFEDSELGARAAIAAGLNVVVVPDLIQPSDFVIQNSYQVVASLDAFLLQCSHSACD
jgi:beta-phosphoglucomutase-like phosphatase (HAD superfamily)